jgi:hypothetical protein
MNLPYHNTRNMCQHFGRLECNLLFPHYRMKGNTETPVTPLPQEFSSELSQEI